MMDYSNLALPEWWDECNAGVWELLALIGASEIEQMRHNDVRFVYDGNEFEVHYGSRYMRLRKLREVERGFKVFVDVNCHEPGAGNDPFSMLLNLLTYGGYI